MKEEKLWALFFATGLPEAYLAIQGVREEEGEGQEKLPAKTAFRAQTPPVQNI